MAQSQYDEFGDRVPSDAGKRMPGGLSALPLALAMVALVAWTALAIFMEAQDKSWGALAIGFIYGPIGSLVIGVFGSLLTIALEAGSRSGQIMMIVFCAIMSAAAIFMAPFCMQLHGC